MKNIIAKYFDDLLLVFGCLLVLRGLSLWSVPLTYIAAGVMSIAFGWMIANAKAKAQDATAKPDLDE